ncbi:hypothetical protein GCM10007362_22230 [Saccharibacillus endophyticus]|uniref:Fibronectin type-III domain-containing protein n=1 Tax=Saccharibacillus endophyticus TaxID=2060666 RepID=A0ABQ1ZT63_9BACL|nr:hypothetical protein GCM10007362_22230 [Saccharibacillus endophyticus]
MKKPAALSYIEVNGMTTLVANDPDNQKVFLFGKQSSSSDQSIEALIDSVEIRNEEQELVSVNDVTMNPNLSRLPFFTSTVPDPGLFIPFQTEQPESGVTTYKAQTVVDSVYLQQPEGVAFAPGSNEVYIADQAANQIVKSTLTPGNGDAFLSETVVFLDHMDVNGPKDVDFADGTLYISETSTGNILKSDESGNVTLLATGLRRPTAIAADGQGGLYVAETGRHRIVKIDTDLGLDGSIEVVAGTNNEGMGAAGGSPLQTALDAPEGVAVAADGTLYISDTGNHRILKMVDKSVYTYDTYTDKDGVEWNMIRTATDLDHIRDNLNGNYRLANDVSIADLSAWVPVGTNDTPFKGRFDGNHYAIKDLNIQTNDSVRNMGLFGSLNEAEIQKVNLLDVNIKAGNYVGALAGESRYSVIKEVTVQGEVWGTRTTGLLVGDSRQTLYTQNNVTGVVHARLRTSGSSVFDFGGLIGDSERDQILYNSVNVKVTTAENPNNDSIGGLAGSVYSGEIRQNAVQGSVEGNYKIGGFIGELSLVPGTVISDNYTWSNVKSLPIIPGTNYDTEVDSVGGFIGATYSGNDSDDLVTNFTVQHNYSSNIVDLTAGNSVQIDRIGAFLGYVNPSYIDVLSFKANYWNKTKNFLIDEYPFAFALSENEMRSDSAFKSSGWDFENIWTLNTQQSLYPTLRPYAEEVTLPPVRPENVQAVASDSKAEVSWTASPEADSYNVYRFEGIYPPEDLNLWVEIAQNVTSTTYTATNLTNDKSYMFAVKAVGTAGASGFSRASNVVVPKGTLQYEYEKKEIDGVVWNVMKTPADLDHIRDDLQGNYILTQDISKDQLDQYLSTQDRTSWKPIGNDLELFGGSFDGGGHTIDGLKVGGGEDEALVGGLFEALNQATVRNLRLTNVDIAPSQVAGGLAATATESVIEKVAVEGSVRGNQYVGGLLGQVLSSTVSESYFRGKVEGYGVLGGLVGSIYMNEASGVHSISNNYAWAKVTPDMPRFSARGIAAVSAGFAGEVIYKSVQLNEVTNSESPIVFQNNYSSSEITAIMFADSHDVIVNDIGIFADAWPFEGPSFESDPISGISNYWDGTYDMPLNETSALAQKLSTAEMKTRSSFKDWDFQNIWSMDTVSGYPILKAFMEQPTNPTNPTNPSTGGGGTSTPVVTTPTPQPTTTTINVNVQNDKAANGAVVSTLTITRTKAADGTVKDQLQFTPAKAREIIELLKASGSKTAAIVLPDAIDEVSEWNLNVPKDAAKLLTDEGVELVILNPNVRITVPASSLTGLTDDLYFRLIPVKSTATSEEIQARALANQEIVATANGGDITVVGRPMTIETNLQSRPVTLTLPLPANSSFTAAQRQKLGVYIEHSDGTKQLVRGTVVTQEDGKLGIEITVNHFSTFTVVNVSNWGSTLIASPYIMGYANGSFKPAQNITRAELAAIVGRITGVTEGTAAFGDVKNGSWASTVVGPAAALGIMTGYGDGTFKPNASITRGELAAALAKLLPQSGLDANIQAAGFSDLAASHWAAAPAAELQAAGVVTGYADGSFKPEQNVTRAEAVTMINRLIGLDGSTALPGAASWNDVADTYWAYDAVRAASMQR